MKRSFVLSMVVVAGLAGVADARPPLSQVAFVNNGLRDVAIADEIRKNCKSISARMIRAYQFISSIEDYAKSQGYSATEIESFVESKADKKRLLNEAKAYLTANGATSEAGHCALGKKEIAKDSQVGVLLRAK